MNTTNKVWGIIPNQQELTRKIHQIKRAGPSSVHVVSDFDQTLTKRLVNGKRLPSVYAEINKYLGQEYSIKEKKLFDTYYPYEVDTVTPLDVKCRKMVEWWQLHLNLMIEYKLDKQTLYRLAKQRELSFRDNADDFFNLLAKNGIPLLIFSAGLGDVITDVLQLEGKLTPNIHIISNVFDFDENGKVTGYKNHVIHTFNKNEVEVKSHPYAQEIKKRRNCIMMGDNLGDLGMTEGLEHDTIIRIGFLNENIDEQLDEFKKNFDMIILYDGTMEKVVWLIDEIVH